MSIKSFFYSIVFLSLFSNAFSQNFKFGVDANIGGAFFKKADLKKSFLFSYGIGVIGNYSFSKNISIQSGLYFSKKGSSFPVTYTDENGFPAGTSNLIFHINYLEIPLQIKFLSNGEKTRCYFMTGLSPSLSLGGRNELVGQNSYTLRDYNTFDLGWITNFGFDFNIKSKTAFIGFKINSGMYEIFEYYHFKNFTYGLSSGLFF